MYKLLTVRSVRSIFSAVVRDVIAGEVDVDNVEMDMLNE